jgi:hypothetical protein
MTKRNNWKRANMSDLIAKDKAGIATSEDEWHVATLTILDHDGEIRTVKLDWNQWWRSLTKYRNAPPIVVAGDWESVQRHEWMIDKHSGEVVLAHIHEAYPGTRLVDMFHNVQNPVIDDGHGGRSVYACGGNHGGKVVYLNGDKLDLRWGNIRVVLPEEGAAHASLPKPEPLARKLDTISDPDPLNPTSDFDPDPF